MKNLYGITKGTKLEQKVNDAYKIEINAVGTYYALSMLAREQGDAKTADALLNLANDEARHAGTYAIMNGLVSNDIFGVLKQVVEYEKGSSIEIKELSKAISELGFEDASKIVENIANDESRHGDTIENLVSDK